MTVPLRPQTRRLSPPRPPIDENDDNAVIDDVLEDMICGIEDEEWDAKERILTERVLSTLYTDTVSGHNATVQAEVPTILIDSAEEYKSSARTRLPFIPEL
jgi:hypothetical protein